MFAVFADLEQTIIPTNCMHASKAAISQKLNPQKLLQRSFCEVYNDPLYKKLFTCRSHVSTRVYNTRQI